MQVKRFPRYLENNPQQFFRLMIAIAAVSLLGILVLAGFGIHYINSRHFVADAERHAVQISRALLALEKAHIVDPAGRIQVPTEALEEIDRRLRHFLQPFDIVKVKIYDAAGRIVYSTDPSIVGKVDRNNVRLARAMAGYNDSKLEKKEEVLDLAYETRIDVDVVETYVPIRNARGEVIGSFEIYQSATGYQKEVFETLQQSILLLALILLAVFSGALALVKFGTDQILLAQKNLRNMAARDPLTGILNRRELFERANNELESAERRGEQTEKVHLGVIMLDIDHFKTINDNFGHAAGDHVLKEIALRIEGTIRRSDFVGRYGGEEFLVILPCASFAETRALAERIRAVIREVPFFFAGHSWQITASLGIAVTDDSPQCFGLALERADEGLYLAKNGGRDQVAWVDAGDGTSGAAASSQAARRD